MICDGVLISSSHMLRCKRNDDNCSCSSIVTINYGKSKMLFSVLCPPKKICKKKEK